MFQVLSEVLPPNKPNSQGYSVVNEGLFLLNTFLWDTLRVHLYLPWWFCHIAPPCSLRLHWWFASFFLQSDRYQVYFCKCRYKSYSAPLKKKEKKSTVTFWKTIAFNISVYLTTTGEDAPCHNCLGFFWLLDFISCYISSFSSYFWPCDAVPKQKWPVEVDKNPYSSYLWIWWNSKEFRNT